MRAASSIPQRRLVHASGPSQRLQGKRTPAIAARASALDIAHDHLSNERLSATTRRRSPSRRHGASRRERVPNSAASAGKEARTLYASISLPFGHRTSLSPLFRNPAGLRFHASATPSIMRARFAGNCTKIEREKSARPPRVQAPDAEDLDHPSRLRAGWCLERTDDASARATPPVCPTLGKPLISSTYSYKIACPRHPAVSRPPRPRPPAQFARQANASTSATVSRMRRS